MAYIDSDEHITLLDDSPWSDAQGDDFGTADVHLLAQSLPHMSCHA